MYLTTWMEGKWKSQEICISNFHLPNINVNHMYLTLPQYLPTECRHFSSTLIIKHPQWNHFLLNHIGKAYSNMFFVLSEAPAIILVHSYFMKPQNRLVLISMKSIWFFHLIYGVQTPTDKITVSCSGNCLWLMNFMRVWVGIFPGAGYSIIAFWPKCALMVRVLYLVWNFPKKLVWADGRCFSLLLANTLPRQICVMGSELIYLRCSHS